MPRDSSGRHGQGWNQQREYIVCSHCPKSWIWKDKLENSPQCKFCQRSWTTRGKGKQTRQDQKDKVEKASESVYLGFLDKLGFPAGDGDAPQPVLPVESQAAATQQVPVVDLTGPPRGTTGAATPVVAEEKVTALPPLGHKLREVLSEKEGWEQVCALFMRMLSAAGHTGVPDDLMGKIESILPAQPSPEGFLGGDTQRLHKIMGEYRAAVSERDGAVRKVTKLQSEVHKAEAVLAKAKESLDDTQKKREDCDTKLAKLAEELQDAMGKDGKKDLGLNGADAEVATDEEMFSACQSSLSEGDLEEEEVRKHQEHKKQLQEAKRLQLEHKQQSEAASKEHRESVRQGRLLVKKHHEEVRARKMAQARRQAEAIISQTPMEQQRGVEQRLDRAVCEARATPRAARWENAGDSEDEETGRDRSRSPEERRRG